MLRYTFIFHNYLINQIYINYCRIFIEMLDKYILYYALLIFGELVVLCISLYTGYF